MIRAFVQVALVGVFAAVSFGQVRDTASIFGTVTDAQAAVVPGANVVLTNTGTGQTRTVSTDASGGYSFPLLPVGTYTATVEQEIGRASCRERV